MKAFKLAKWWYTFSAICELAWQNMLGPVDEGQPSDKEARPPTIDDEVVQEWLKQGRLYKATHLLVLYDVLRGLSVPRFVFPGESLALVTRKLDKNVLQLVRTISINQLEQE